jgi:hypothetical protein
MQLGSRLRMPWRRSVIRTSWDDSYTFAKTERPSLVSPTPLPHEATLAVECPVEEEDQVTLVVTNKLALADPQEEEVVGRFTWPTFVYPFLTPLHFEVPHADLSE